MAERVKFFQRSQKGRILEFQNPELQNPEISKSKSRFESPLDLVWFS